jgi:hypothetical protein
MIMLHPEMPCQKTPGIGNRMMSADRSNAFKTRPSSGTIVRHP